MFIRLTPKNVFPKSSIKPILSSLILVAVAWVFSFGRPSGLSSVCGKKGTTEERKKVLNKLGVDKVILISEAKKIEKTQTYITTEWIKNFEHLKNIDKQKVDINKISRDYELDKEFGNWLNNQKKRYRLNQLNDEQEELLRSTSLILNKDDSRESRWNTFFELLTEYYQTFGNTKVLPSYDIELSSWCGTQRKNFRDKELSNERMEKLNSIKFEWVATNGKKKNSHQH